MSAAQCMRDNMDDILERFAAGETCQDIGASLPVPANSMWIRETMRANEPARYDAALMARGYEFFERNVGIARKAEALGDGAGLRVAADIHFKLAAKLNPSELGDKTQVALTGSLALRVEDLTDEALAQIARRTVGPVEGA